MTFWYNNLLLCVGFFTQQCILEQKATVTTNLFYVSCYAKKNFSIQLGMTSGVRDQYRTFYHWFKTLSILQGPFVSRFKVLRKEVCKTQEMKSSILIPEQPYSENQTEPQQLQQLMEQKTQVHSLLNAAEAARDCICRNLLNISADFI